MPSEDGDDCHRAFDVDVERLHVPGWYPVFLVDRRARGSERIRTETLEALGFEPFVFTLANGAIESHWAGSVIVAQLAGHAISAFARLALRAVKSALMAVSPAE